MEILVAVVVTILVLEIMSRRQRARAKADLAKLVTLLHELARQFRHTEVVVEVLSRADGPERVIKTERFKPFADFDPRLPVVASDPANVVPGAPLQFTVQVSIG